MNRNWHNDPWVDFKSLYSLIKFITIDFRVGFQSPSSLIELIEIDAYLEQKLKQFERAFERDEIVDI